MAGPAPVPVIIGSGYSMLSLPRLSIPEFLPAFQPPSGGKAAALSQGRSRHPGLSQGSIPAALLREGRMTRADSMAKRLVLHYLNEPVISVYSQKAVWAL